MVSRVGLALAAMIVLCALLPWAARAAETAQDKDYVESQDEIFDMLREVVQPEYAGDVVEDAIQQFFETGKGGEVDEGTYPPSEIWDRDFDLRRSKPATWNYSGRVFGRFSDDKVSGVTKWEKELELNLDYKDLSSYFRFSDFNPFANINDPFRWEKARVRYKTDKVKYTVGSFGALFNRGLALNMYEDRTLDFDSEAEGAKVEWELSEKTDFTALWGTRKNRSDKRDSEVAGARMAIGLGNDATVGLNAVDVTFPDSTYNPEKRNARHLTLMGGDVDLRLGDFQLNAETVQVNHETKGEVESAASQLIASGEGTSRGYYANANYSTSGMSLSAEYKNYRGLAQPFSVLPPLRRWNEEATANPQDDLGYGAALNLSPAGDGSFYQLHYMQDNAHDGRVRHTELAGIYSSPASGKTTWVGEYWYVQDAQIKHNVERLTLNQKLTDDWTASTFIEHERLAPGFVEAFVDYIIEGEVAYQSILNVVYTAETTGQEVAEGKRDRWGIWEFKYRPDEEDEFNLAVGSRRQGFVCSGGVCRLEPEFDGVKVDYLRRF